eukprot:8268-Pelagomonas_calceolata.AAC.1
MGFSLAQRKGLDPVQCCPGTSLVCITRYLLLCLSSPDKRRKVSSQYLTSTRWTCRCSGRS